MADDANQFVLALRRLNTELTSSNRAVAASAGLHESDLAVLDLLHQDGPSTPAALTRRTRIHPATMTNVLDRLQRDGWIERRPDDQDRRSTRIHPAGVERLTTVFAAANARFAALVDTLSEDQVTLVVGVLDEVVQIIRDEAAQLPEPARSTKE